MGTRNLLVILATALLIALPFMLRQRELAGDWRPGDPIVIVMSPHNEAIRYEFGLAFSSWHQSKFGTPAKIEWLNVGGTTEISRYLTSEYIAAMRAWWIGQGRAWPLAASDRLLGPPSDADDQNVRAIRQAFREKNNALDFGVRVDLFFGGGEYDHSRAYQQGLTVIPWAAGSEPAALSEIPTQISGETWRTDTLFGTTVSTFGICYNLDRLRDLGVTSPPREWIDLTDPVYYRQIGIVDPTKSGSIAKAFEMIIQQQCQLAVAEKFSTDEINRFEAHATRSGTHPSPSKEALERAAEYAQAIDTGWRNGLRLIQLIGANARYFTDAASKVPIDVAAGDAAAGLSIDFYARFQAEMTGGSRMEYVTPVGGSSVSCDPISLLRGAPNPITARRFIEFVLSTEGQKLWTYRPGTPGGPAKYALRRLPIRSDFYEHAAQHQPYAADNLSSPLVNPYRLAEAFTYRPRWTGPLFNAQRDLIRAMCMDSADELQAAWRAIIRNGGPDSQPEAMALLVRLPDRPEPLTWANARAITTKYDRMTYTREWTEFYRRSYREAAERAIRTVARDTTHHDSSVHSRP